MSKESPTPNSYDKRRIENLANPMFFDELLGLASEVCLCRSFELKPRDDILDGEAAVIAKIGVRGLRVALDLIDNGSADVGEERQSEETSEHVWVDSPLRETEYFSDQPNLDLIDQAKQFGDAMLTEAYTTLGQDVHDKIKQFRVAETDDEQIEIIAWLDLRLHDMTEKSRGLDRDETEETNTSQYHPVRLSPKAIGRYPQHRLAPTCLGVSVIAASFFEQTGVDHLHAGVMETALSYNYRQAMAMIEVIISIMNEMWDTVPDELAGSIVKMYDALLERYACDDGYHAANYIRLKSNKWYQFDSNFSALQHVEYMLYNKALDDIFAELREFETIAPGLERTARMGLTTVSDNLLGWLESGVRELGDRQVIEPLLLGNPESIAEHIISDCIDPFFTAGIEKVDEHLQTNILTLKESPEYSDAFHSCFAKYVLWGEPLDDVLSRCHQDPIYLARRVEDIQNLPIVMTISIAMMYTNTFMHDISHNLHSTVELGLPAQRIGMAVLSDFATYCDDRLPPGFWLSQWPSHVPVTETLINYGESSDAQRSIMRNSVAQLKDECLRYTKSYGIVNSFLDRLAKEKEDDNS